MHFLIVNDDGINSPFLPILTQAVKRAGHRVTVCDAAERKGTCIQHRAADSGGEARSARCG